MLKECQVVRVSTKEKTSIIYTTDGHNLYYDFHVNINDNVVGERTNSEFCHLYILSDENIKKGDWTYNEKGTPNVQLKQICGCNTQYGWNKIIASTDPNLNLPQPSKAFIKKYCEKSGIDNVMVEYNVNQNVKEFKTEADFFQDNVFSEELKVSPDNTITIKPVKDSYTRDEVLLILSQFENDVEYWSKNKTYLL